MKRLSGLETRSFLREVVVERDSDGVSESLAELSARMRVNPVNIEGRIMTRSEVSSERPVLYGK